MRGIEKQSGCQRGQNEFSHFLPKLRPPGMCVHLHVRSHAERPENRLLTYDKDQCASCYMCIMACPYGILKEDQRTKKVILKCDMCAQHGHKPQCAAKCPMNAITLKEVVS